MLVHFKPTSEYKTNYNPQSSHKSQSFNPSPEQAAPMAGVNSEKLAIPEEPPIQHKKRIVGPSTTLSMDYYEKKPLVQDEYMLLGNNEKFTENVRYRSKGSVNGGRDVSPPKQPKLQEKKYSSQTKSKYVKENKDPVPAPVVDTSKFRDPKTPLAPRRPKGQQSSVLNEVKESFKENQANLDSSDFAPKVLLKDKKIVDNMNEFVQTDMNKGVMDSAPEAPAEYSLKYKAGISAPRPTKKFSEYQKEFTWKDRILSSPILAAEQMVYNSIPSVAPLKKDVFPKKSEYGAQFKSWDEDQEMKMEEGPKQKRGIPEKQKKSFERKIERESEEESKDRLARPKKADRMRQGQNQDDANEISKNVSRTQVVETVLRVRSEYVANFQAPWKYDYKDGAWKGANPPHLQYTQPQDKGTEKEEKPHSSWFAEVVELRKKADEYRRRAQGTHFSRQHLVQLLAKQTEIWDVESVQSTGTLSALSLESGASIAEKRDQKNNQDKIIRDNDSNKATIATEDSHSRTQSPDSDEKLPQKRVPQKFTSKQYGKPKHQSKNQKKVLHTKKSQSKQVDDFIETPYEVSEDQEDKPPKVVGSRKFAWVDKGSQTVNRKEGYDEEGRIPTPTLKTAGENSRRHHLDRTTPAIGGAILSSPPSQRNTFTRRQQHVSQSMPIMGKEDIDDDGSDGCSTVEDEPVQVQNKPQFSKTYGTNKYPVSMSPTFGMPSRDTHFLRDDAASEDRYLRTSFVNQPKVLDDEEQEDTDYTRSKLIKERRSRPKNSGLDIPSTLKEGMGQTYNLQKPVQEKFQLPLTKSNLVWAIDGGQPVARQDTDDVLSVSARSVASSCSLASETLERASRRQDFWLKSGLATR
ncbi:hypothetical protein ScPMuIL_008446 [Solemya velum]